MSELIFQIANILAPGMCLAIVGLIWFHKGPEYPVGFVTTLVLNITLPALLFHTLTVSQVPVGVLGKMVVATLIVHLLFTTVAIALLKVAGKDWRLCIAHVVGNTGNLGLPVCLFTFGEEGLAYGIAFFAVQCVLMFSLGDAIYAGAMSANKLLRSPILYAILLGVIVRLFDWQPPELLMQSTKLLGQIVIPLMLVTLGVSLAGMRASQLPTTLVWSAIRTVVAACIGFAVAVVMDLEGTARGVLIIQTVAPVALFNYLLAEKHGRDSSEITGLILVTHVGAIFYLPVVLGFLLIN